MAATNGTIIYVIATITSPLAIPPSNNPNDFIGPTKPIKPKPAEFGAPLILNKPPISPDTAAEHTIGKNIIGCRIVLGIINLTAPRSTVIGTPTLFTRHAPTANTIAQVPAPIAAEPAANPDIPIATPIPMDDIGDTIRIEKIIAINIVIIIGCVFVKLLTKLPMPTVINLV